MNENSEIKEGFTKAELINHLDELCKAYEKVPPQAQFMPVTHSDFHTLLSLLGAILRAS